ncbi:TetR/AcrR family transcriptional regulator [Roseateles amylovorans]|jgi:TetR/AcrR family transcriptional regulator, regulator of autoinduction and epiphytic fitness|uniref:TetR/AcrR family transcriptional regulator n=1 Tax=Roseateles amylovorans TaxID=2978473 RepID=A0ABY6AY49_9BURK|nr:TetR/AcrR family transcriptional regulator [Roseateles amylovorans]UXH77319.1 TetR/AcrR family transcriptional regulator [Roseateles amylovorans]
MTSDVLPVTGETDDAPTPLADDASCGGSVEPVERTRLTDRKRQAIVDAAIAEFREHGFEVANMDRIAARAQVSKRTVYNHFPGKDALFDAILERLWAATEAQVKLAYRADRPLREQLLMLIEQKLAMSDDPQFLDLARVLIAEAIHAPQRAREMLCRLGGREEGLTVWIRAAMADGRLRSSDPVFAAAQLQALVKGFAFWPQITMGQPPLDAAQQRQVADASADMFLRSHAVEGKT